MTELKRREADSPPFDRIRHTRSDGSEYWDARELMTLMGYATWQNFRPVLSKAWKNAELVGLPVEQNFMEAHKVAGSGPAAQTARLSRLACYLTALAADSAKPRVAEAKLYFAAKTREAEIRAVPRELSRMEILKLALESEERALAAEARAAELSPKGEAFDAYLSADGSESMATVAKMLGTGQNRLFRILRDSRVLISQAGVRFNTPYQEYVERGWFDVVAGVRERSSGDEEATYTTRVRPKGVEGIRKLLAKI